MQADRFDMDSSQIPLLANLFSPLVLEQMKPLHFRLRMAQLYVGIVVNRPDNFATRKRLAHAVQDLADAGRSWQDYLDRQHGGDALEQRALTPLILGCLSTLFLKAERLEAVKDARKLEHTLNLALERWEELKEALEVAFEVEALSNQAVN